MPLSETFRTSGTVGSKDQYGVLVDETASVRRILGQLCCLHRATARLQWKAAKGCGNIKPPQNERHCLAEYESQSAMNDDCWWNCGSKLLMLLGSRVTCPSLTDPSLEHLGHLGSGLWSQPAQIPWLAPKHVGKAIFSLECVPEWLCDYWYCTSSTAQGGGGSFKNRKPIGENGCCESGMSERIHWWTERCSLFLWLSTHLPTYIPCIYLSIYRSIYRSIYLSVDRSIYLSISLSTYLSF